MKLNGLFNVKTHLVFGWLLLLSSSVFAETEQRIKAIYTEVGESVAVALNNKDEAAMRTLFDSKRFSEQVAIKVFAEEKPKFRGSFVNGLNKGISDSIATGWIKLIERNNGIVKFINIIKVDGVRRSVLRLDLGEEGVNFLELLVDARTKTFYDVYVHTSGQLLSDSSASMAAMTFADSENIIGRFLGQKTLNKEVHNAIKTMTAAHKNQQFDQAYLALSELPESIKNSRIMFIFRILVASGIRSQSGDDSKYRLELAALAKHHGDDPELALMLVDHFAYTQEYEKGLAALDGLMARLGEDSILTQLKAAVAMEQGQLETAHFLADKAIQMEPERIEAYWVLVTILLKQQNHAAVARQLNLIAERFSLEFDLATLRSLPEYAQFIASPEFKTWSAQWEG